MQFSEDRTSFEANATLEDIYYCFRLLLGRNPSCPEWIGHSARVGERLDKVVSSYVSSLEFFNRKLMRPPSDQFSLVALDGFSLFASPDDLAVGKHIIASGDYEPGVSRPFREAVSPGMHVVDIGANIGFYSMLAGSLVGPSGRVWAVEPNPDNVRMIIASRARNAFEHVEVIQAAADERWGTLGLFRDGSNGTVGPASASDPSELPTTVICLPLDACLAHNRIDIVKIDVEGAEGRVLRGMSHVLAQSSPIIFSEFTPGALPGMSGMTPQQFLEFLLRPGYDVTVLLENPVACGHDIGRVMACFENSGLAHVDLIARPQNATNR